MVKILILSFYYEPDLCAGSFRCTALVNSLSLHGIEIDVVTTAPNRYASFTKQTPQFEQRGNVAIHRIAIPSHIGGIVDQMKAFSKYYKKAKRLVAKNDYDIIFATSSRLFTAFLGARIARKKKLPLYLDVRDIFRDTMIDILPPTLTWLANPIISIIERYTFNSANHINLVSEGFLQYFEHRYPRTSFSFFTNGIDKEFIKLASPTRQKQDANSIINVLYAGNIGEGQGLHKVVPELAKQLKNQLKFIIIGDGGQRKILENSIAELALDNVVMLPPMDRSGLIDEYLKADVLFLHLNNYTAFEKVLPSKLFEYAAIGKPIWAGLNGYSATFANSEIIGCKVFSSGNLVEAIEKFHLLPLNVPRRFDFISKFNREIIMKKMALDILRVYEESV